MEEIDSVRADLKRKKQAAAGRAPRFRREATTSQQLENGAAFGGSHLTGDEKTSLAINMSVASVPGAFGSNGNNDTTWNSSILRAKPSQDQLMEIANLRSNQKDRDAYQQPDRGLEEFRSDDVDPIADLQARMHGYDAQHKSQEEEQAQKRHKNVLVVATIIIIVIIGGAIGRIVFGLNKGKDTSIEIAGGVVPESPESLDVFSSSCAVSRTIEGHSERYIQLRSMIGGRFLNMTSSIDVPQSHERLALCWVSDLDSLQVDVSDEGIIQRYILALVYFQLDQPKLADIPQHIKVANWNWLSGIHECEWDYIDCADSKKVRRLELSRPYLVGRIPTELSLLTSLLSIEMRLNALTGEIPSEIWNMKQLEELWLHSNQLSGPVFRGATGFSALSIIEISSNLLTWKQPDTDWGLPNLEILGANENEFEGPFSDLSKSTKLGKNAQSNFCASPVLAIWLSVLSLLLAPIDQLHLGQMQLTGEIPEYVWNLTNLSK